MNTAQISSIQNRKQPLLPRSTTNNQCTPDWQLLPTLTAVAGPAERRAEQRSQRIETKLDNIDGRFDAFERHVDKRFDALKRKLDGRFRGIDGRLVTFEQDLDEGFRRVRERIDSLERRLAKKNPGREQEQTKPEQGAPDGDAGPGCAGRCGAQAVADPRARPEPRDRGTASHASKVRLRRGPDFEVLANGASAP